MPLYAYRCPQGFDFEAMHAMGRAPASVSCPDCGEPAARQFSAPHLSRASGSAYRLIEGAERSASEPAVVRSPGPRARSGPGNISAHPLHRKLPRPD